MTDPLARRLGLGMENLGGKNQDAGPDMFQAEVTPPRKPDRWCAHCGRFCGDMAGGFASYNGEALCHPNEKGRPDCYKLVQAGHPMPCLRCLADRVTDENIEAMLEAEEK